MPAPGPVWNLAKLCGRLAWARDRGMLRAPRGRGTVPPGPRREGGMVPRITVRVSCKIRVEKPPWGLAFGKPVTRKGWEWQNRGEDFPPVFSAFSAGRGRAESRRVRGLQKLGGLRARCEAFRSCVAEGRLLSFVFSCRCYQHKVRRLTGRAPVPFIFHPIHKEGIGLSSTLLQRLWQCRAPRSSPPQVRECGEARSGRARGAP